jgi:hypothetical protein
MVTDEDFTRPKTRLRLDNRFFTSRQGPQVGNAIIQPEFGQFMFTARDTHHACTAFGKDFRRDSPDTPASPGYQGYSSFNTRHVRIPLLNQYQDIPNASIHMNDRIINIRYF